MTSTRTKPKTLAREGGAPLRSRPLPCGRQHIDDADVAAVVSALKSDWLTTGPRVEQFESDFAAYVGARHAVAVLGGPAALHVMLADLGVGPGDEVLVPAMTFDASANAVLHCRAKPVFVAVADAIELPDSEPALAESNLEHGRKAG